MKLFRNLLIRRKLTIVMMLSSAVTLLVACVTWLTYDWAAYRGSLVEQISLVGEVIGKSAVHAIGANDVEGVSGCLTVLRGQDLIHQAVVFDQDGEVLATYVDDVREIRPKPIPPRRDGHVLGEGTLVVYQPILLADEQIATIAIESDLSGLQVHLLKFSGILFPLLGICILTSFLMSSRLQEVISGPITRLTDTVRAVSERKDYALRVRKQGSDEVGFLTEAFNEMLATIQDRDAELERHRNTLEEQVEQRTRELTEKNEQLQHSMEEAKAAAVAKSRFLANMSHEIRTPMNGILGMNELLLGSPLSDQQRSYAEIVKGSAESLLELINDILDFSKIEAGKLRLEEIDFEPYKTVEEVVGLLSGPAHKKGLDLVCWIAPNIPSILRGDPTRLRQIITNLVGNAIKFTEYGRISVRVERLEESDKDVRLRVFVQDTGIGISERQRRRLFKSFSQVDSSTTRKYGGTGLGLAISQQLVELMGGEIGVESEMGVGSTFWFTARFQKIVDESIRSFILPEKTERPRILVADSSAAVREVLHQQLKAWQIDHEIAADATRVHSAVRVGFERSEPFGLIFLDDLVLRDGGEMLDEILTRSQAESRTRIVLMSWKGAGEDEGCSPGFEIHGRLSKPIRPSQLFDTVLALVHDLDGDGIEDGVIGEGTEEASSPAASDLRILLAEDNEINQLVATKILAKGGYSCRVVRDGSQALRVMDGGDFDVVLMDCQMPEMDGFEATRRIREIEAKTPERKPVHIIALTANAMNGDRERCINAGMDDYLSKPVKPEVLLEKMRRFQEEHRERFGVEVAGYSSGDPPFDLEHLLERYGGRRTDLSAAIASLDRRTIDCLGRIKSCLGAEYGDEIADVVQDLREAIALVSSERLHYLAVELERLAGERRFDQASECFDELQREFARCRACLPEVLARAEWVT